MRAYQIKTFILSLFVSLTAFGKADCRHNPRTLSCLYSQVNALSDEGKLESENLVLKNYHLVIWSATWCASCQSIQPLWEGLAQRISKDLNVVVVYDNYYQDLNSLKSKAPLTRSYDHFDKTRQLYYWFQDLQTNSNSTQDAVAKAVLIGPGDKILYAGTLTGEDQLKEIESKLKINSK